MDINLSTEGSASSREQRQDPTSTEEQEFLDWLRSNGALFHDVHWPSSETESGLRGAIATRDIDSGVRERTRERKRMENVGTNAALSPSGFSF